MMTVCFDTSAINHLLKDPQQSTLTSALFKRFQSRVTALNVVEIARTATASKREALRALEYQLAGGLLPFELPNELLQSYTRVLIAGTGELSVAIADERSHLWHAMASADAVTPEVQDELGRWISELNESRARGAEMRKGVEEKFPDPLSRPRTPAALIRQFMLRENWLLVYSFSAQVVKMVTGKVLPASKLDELIEARPGFWSIFLAATVLQMYHDTFWDRQLGRRSNVGLLDLWAGIYLPLCDVFVTNDFAQYDALRVLNLFSKKRPRARVLLWNHFREDLLIAD